MGVFMGRFTGQSPLALHAGPPREEYQRDIAQSTVGGTTLRALRGREPSWVNHAGTPRRRSLWVSVPHKRGFDETELPAISL